MTIRQRSKYGPTRVLDGDVQDYAGNGFDVRFGTSDGTAMEVLPEMVMMTTMR